MSRPQRGQGVYSEETFSSVQLSASRLNALSQCGEAFNRKYMKGEVETQSGSASLFGSVMHEALDHWAMNRTSSLLTLTRAAWLSQTEGTPVNDFLGAYGALSIQAIRKEHEIRTEWESRGKESKAPRMTKVWKDSKVAKDIDKLVREWQPRMEAQSPWKFTDRDPLPSLYDESLVLSKRYEHKWAKLPNALYTELAFDTKWHRDGVEWLLNGYIDAIEPLIEPKTGELIAILVTDYKTYRNEPPAGKDEHQFTIYDIALRTMLERGDLELPDVPIFVCMDYVRLLDRKVRALTTAAYDEFAAAALVYKATVEGKLFTRAEKNRNPDFCGFEDCCLKRTLMTEVEVDWDAITH